MEYVKCVRSNMSLCVYEAVKNLVSMNFRLS